jgi:hypothetical protein
VAIEVTARARDGEVCPYCRVQLASTADELFECPACATRTHAACRREAGRCTTAGCTGPPPGTAAEAARRRRVEATAPAPGRSPAPPRRGRSPGFALALAAAGLVAGAASVAAGEWELAGLFVVSTLLVACLELARADLR